MSYDDAVSFDAQVFAAVRRIPAGHVATYGQIAALIGKPRAARAVGNALHRNRDSAGTSCFRVVNAQGYLSGAYAFGGPFEQKRRLEEDGIPVVNQQVDLSRYQWQPETSSAEASLSSLPWDE